MPRRRKPAVPPGKFVIDGVYSVVQRDGIRTEAKSDNAVSFDRASTLRRVQAAITSLPQLSLVGQQQLAEDLTTCAGKTVTSGLDLLVSGRHTKPREWDAQCLLRSIALVMVEHGLPVTVWEDEGGTRSLF